MTLTDPGYELIRRIAYATAKRKNMLTGLTFAYALSNLSAIDISTR